MQYNSLSIAGFMYILVGFFLARNALQRFDIGDLFKSELDSKLSKKTMAIIACITLMFLWGPVAVRAYFKNKD